MVDLLQRALDAHGGLEKWQAAEQVRVRLRSGGRLFDVRLQGHTISRATGSGAVVHFSTDVPGVMFEGFPRPGYRGYFEQGAVRIEADQADRPLYRANAREAFSRMSHKLKWDTLDALYFAGYALWNYVSTPFMLARPGFQLREGEPWHEGDETWRRLEAISPRIFRLIPASRHSSSMSVASSAGSITRRRCFPPGPVPRTTATTIARCRASWCRRVARSHYAAPAAAPCPGPRWSGSRSRTLSSSNVAIHDVFVPLRLLSPPPNVPVGRGECRRFVAI